MIQAISNEYVAYITMYIIVIRIHQGVYGIYKPEGPRL